jgi:hypothetical protein
MLRMVELSRIQLSGLQPVEEKSVILVHVLSPPWVVEQENLPKTSASFDLLK